MMYVSSVKSDGSAEDNVEGGRHSRSCIYFRLILM
jgi:hypothetical protein